MRKLFYLLILVLAFGMACTQDNDKEVETHRTKSIDEFIRMPTNNGQVEADQMAKIEFENYSYHFDTLQEGEKVEHIFPFTNTGKQSLKIADVTSTCGCTVPYFPEEVIPPGEKSEIRVVFDSEGKIGSQDKKISIFANTYPNETTLSMKGFVVEKKE